MKYLYYFILIFILFILLLLCLIRNKSNYENQPKNIKIHKWAGRLGNNIITLVNGLILADYYNCNVKLPDHDFLNTNYVIFNKNIKLNEKPDITSVKYQHFFRRKNTKNHKNAFNNINKKIILNKLNNIFKFNYKNIDLGNNSLLIHIRSGDAFDISNYAPRYVMPPISYYKNIINNNNYKNINIISEDTKNPCINELIKLYPNIKFKLKSLEEDINLILNVENIIISNSTMIPSIVLFSKKIKKIYMPSYINNLIIEYNKKPHKDKIDDVLFLRDDINIEYIDLDNYYKELYPWKPNKENIKKMLTY